MIYESEAPHRRSDLSQICSHYLAEVVDAFSLIVLKIYHKQ
eukprot:SAG31_NODE_25220_length_465_cov_6.079235_2_plen_40_part_01